MDFNHGYMVNHLEGDIDRQRERLKECIDHWNGGHILVMYSNLFYDFPDEEEEDEDGSMLQEEQYIVRGGPKIFPGVPRAYGPSTKEIIHLLRRMPLDEREHLFDRLLDSDWMQAAISRHIETKSK